jgi:2-amino-4-hydroxy-6-hydroxymethyldihydropteridine diphosphokinase
MRVIIGLGSNLGSRITNILNAIALMKSLLSLTQISLSKFYASRALTRPNAQKGSKDKEFINLVISCENYHAPSGLLQGLKYIERKMGRPALYSKWEPRVIDLDILLFSEVIINNPELIIPHKEMFSRDFVLEPICDLMPGSLHPKINKSFFDLKYNLKVRYVTKKFLL